MKHKTLHVENFGPIGNASVELRAVNLFIGEQSIGKSTLAKLITVFTDYISLCKLIKGGIDLWDYQLKEYNLDIYMNDDYFIAYDMMEEGKRFHIEFRPKHISYYLTIGDETITEADRIFTHIMDLKLDKIYHTEEIIRAAKEPEKKNLLELLTNSIYIPAERIIYSVLTNLMPALTLASSTVPKNLLRFMVELGNAKSEYPDFHIQLLNVAFKHEAAGDTIVIDDADKNIPISAASSGIQSLVPLLLVLHYAITKREYSSFVIEEPECNLFPTKQVELLKEILKAVKHPTRTLTITTHSPYLLSAMNNLLFAGMLTEQYGEGIKSYIDDIVPQEYQLKACDCSVYSLGKEINGGEYCRSLMDPETGMIDFNSLDEVSEELGGEFESLQGAVVEFMQNR
ncbi:MAG: ATP-binding protein [Bacteroides sp.]|nr:ATP-binding protein [Bacteroides sp.]